MEWEYCSKDFTDKEWVEGINLHRWRCYINKGHYEKKDGVIYFDVFCYNLIEVEIERRANLGEEGKGKRFY